MAGEPRSRSNASPSALTGGGTGANIAGNPVLDLDLADFRDPNVFWHEPTRRWIMVVVLSGEQRALVYASHNLKHWDELSRDYGSARRARSGNARC